MPGGEYGKNWSGDGGAIGGGGGGTLGLLFGGGTGGNGIGGCHSWLGGGGGTCSPFGHFSPIGSLYSNGLFSALTLSGFCLVRLQ